ncbi:hypothetical protein RCF27_01245 [Rhodococcus pyridinivorans]|uniref:hypothetical protein n=1 Tax=Rhodococcus pyridinivorans TaxID=103816 RepID=UPI00280B4F16|nr:hypothetical protein [Rhodococcus pyridinivorans]WMM73009.1 hypothetical protein RCF27_01245 [Rhodococcus pyridinivorans]
MVTALCELTRPEDTMCVGCAWDNIIKPLATPLIGWGRGYPPKQAKDRDHNAPRYRYVNIAEVLEEQEGRPPAESDTERWLRTSEAWDAVTEYWLARLDTADPGNGHGICSHQRGDQ